MFLTRMGMNTKMIITGDLTQIDLPSSVRSGLSHAMHILRDVKGIGIVELNKKDIVRHKLVTRIVEAYEKEASPNSQARLLGADKPAVGATDAHPRRPEEG